MSEIIFHEEFEGRRPFAVLKVNDFKYHDIHKKHLFSADIINQKVITELSKTTAMVLIPFYEFTPWNVLDLCEWSSLKCGLVYPKKDVKKAKYPYCRPFTKDDEPEDTQHHAITKIESMVVFCDERPYSTEKLEETIIETLSYIKNGVVRERLVGEIAKVTGIGKGALKKEVNTKVVQREKATKQLLEYEEEERLFLPDHVDRTEFIKTGFYEDDNPGKAGYWFAEGLDSVKQISNFIIRPLFHVKDMDDNKRLAEIDNGIEKLIIEAPSSAFISLERFQSLAFDHGNFLFEGTKHHLMRINRKLGSQFPPCYELKTLGWQKEKFFAFNNVAIKDGRVQHMDEYGIVALDDKNFYSPSSSQIQKGYREENDPYENDRFLTYLKPDIDFVNWATLMKKVYGDHKGVIGVSFVAISLFKDIIFNVDNSCPILYPYGQVGSGKTKYGESISAVFFHNLNGFNLNQGTDFAFWSRFERFRNCPMTFNEFDEEAIKEEWFRAFKAAYDGEGRERGVGGKMNKTKAQKINCSVVLVGQILSTKDDGSVLTRSLPLSFEPNDERSNDQVKEFNKLKEIEKKGLTGLIIEILKTRDDFEKKYIANFTENFKALKEAIKLKKASFKERIVRNYCAAFTSYQILKQNFEALPWSEKVMFDLCRDEIIKLSDMIAETNALAEFWRTLNFIFDQGRLDEGSHFKIEQAMTVNVDNGRGSQDVKVLEGGKKVLYLRLSIIHQLYAQECRHQGKRALNAATIRNYMESEKAFIGATYNTRFEKTSTSAIMFDYDLLDLNIETEIEQGDLIELEGIAIENSEMVDKGFGPCIEFKTMKDESYTAENNVFIKKEIITRCIIKDPKKIEIIPKGSQLKIKGYYTERMFKGFLIRNMDVTSYEIKGQTSIEADPTWFN